MSLYCLYCASQINSDCINSTTKIKSVSPSLLKLIRNRISCQSAKTQIFFLSLIHILCPNNFHYKFQEKQGESLPVHADGFFFINHQHMSCVCFTIQCLSTNTVTVHSWHLLSLFSSFPLLSSPSCCLHHRWAWSTVLHGSSTVRTARHCPWITTPATGCPNSRSETLFYFIYFFQFSK